jgi:8-oxo-dGTP diphosphatase
VQLRVREPEQLLARASEAAELCNKYSARLLLNTSSSTYSKISARKNVGLYLNSINLLACDNRPVAKDILLGASCHNNTQIEHAQKIGVDFICLSPVLKTSSHPELKGIGWESFSNLLENAVVPVYALGGMRKEDLSIALARGAQGIAAISEWW